MRGGLPYKLLINSGNRNLASFGRGREGQSGTASIPQSLPELFQPGNPKIFTLFCLSHGNPIKTLIYSFFPLLILPAAKSGVSSMALCDMAYPTPSGNVNNSFQGTDPCHHSVTYIN